MTKITYIPGEIANAAIDEHGNRKPVTRTQHIFDDAKNKNQAEINADIDNTLALHQSEINALDSGNYVSVDTYSELPSTGSIDTIYRVCNWDGSANDGEGAVDGTVYSQYAWDSTNSEYKLLCVRTQIGEVFDISLWNAVGGVLATYDNLADALGTNGANVPAGIRKGGMSIKFVQTSDNKYIQFRCMPDQFSTNVEDWSFCGNEVLMENPEFIKAWTDALGHLLFWIGVDGSVDWAIGVPAPVKAFVDACIAEILSGNTGTSIDGLNKVIAFLDGFSTSDTLAALLNTKVGKVTGKSLINEDFASRINYEENPEYSCALIDAIGHILIGVKSNGKAYIPEIEGIEQLISSCLLKNNIPLLRKRISILGDSISTYNQEGYKIDGYSMYYPKSEFEVTDVNDTWWKKFINKTESVIEVNASSGGSTASSLTLGFYPRVELLGNPNMIFVELGTNDCWNNVDIGTIDYDSENPDVTKFAPAYIKGIKGILERYPDATVVCMIFEMDDDYADTIKQIANHYNIAYVDVRKYSGPPHPDKEGMIRVTDKIMEDIIIHGILLTKL